ncbi:hypothetical protein RFI_21618 [Reticulomyxa filosa]|uniref:Uncharacterized protein n=1 Tax=Reticulomyxa filosa TaxID=46433 RepID=X6MRL8_RETFI|nr:hypothetical protein RFI_21618 [Reticulomyxa filosa]|eukprot:ETO15745.1 hypothetical protein RFI_21618 [Reticulomyxa filosa]
MNDEEEKYDHIQEKQNVSFAELEKFLANCDLSYLARQFSRHAIGMHELEEIDLEEASYRKFCEEMDIHSQRDRCRLKAKLKERLCQKKDIVRHLELSSRIVTINNSVKYKNLKRLDDQGKIPKIRLILTTHTFIYLFVYVEANESYEAVLVELWDTPGRGKFTPLYKNQVQQANGAIIMYDVNNRKSLQRCSECITEIDEIMDNIQMAVVANKIDIKRQEHVTFNEGLDFATQNRAKFYEISCATSKNVSASFTDFVELIYRNVRPIPRIANGDIVIDFVVALLLTVQK